MEGIDYREFNKVIIKKAEGYKLAKKTKDRLAENNTINEVLELYSTQALVIDRNSYKASIIETKIKNIRKDRPIYHKGEGFVFNEVVDQDKTVELPGIVQIYNLESVSKTYKDYSTSNNKIIDIDIILKSKEELEVYNEFIQKILMEDANTDKPKNNSEALFIIGEYSDNYIDEYLYEPGILLPQRIRNRYLATLVGVVSEREKMGSIEITLSFETVTPYPYEVIVNEVNDIDGSSVFKDEDFGLSQRNIDQSCKVSPQMFTRSKLFTGGPDFNVSIGNDVSDFIPVRRRGKDCYRVITNLNSKNVNLMDGSRDNNPSNIYYTQGTHNSLELEYKFKEGIITIGSTPITDISDDISGVFRGESRKDDILSYLDSNNIEKKYIKNLNAASRAFKLRNNSLTKNLNDIDIMNNEVIIIDYDLDIQGNQPSPKSIQFNFRLIDGSVQSVVKQLGSPEIAHKPAGAVTRAEFSVIVDNMPKYTNSVSIVVPGALNVVIGSYKEIRIGEAMVKLIQDDKLLFRGMKGWTTKKQSSYNSTFINNIIFTGLDIGNDINEDMIKIKSIKVKDGGAFY